MVWRKNQLDLWDGTVFLAVCGIGYAGYIYYLAVTKSYEVVEGTVTEIHAELFLMVLRGFWCKGMMGLPQSFC